VAPSCPRRAVGEAKKLKEIRLELADIPSPFREETVNFTVSIGGANNGEHRPRHESACEGPRSS
jgi:hypothetical protein